MHGAGNDFVVLDCTKTRFQLSTEQLIRLADRHFGVGADQILVVEPAPSEKIDFRYRIFNKDGGEVEQCGNGARCFMKFIHEHGLTNKKKVNVQTMAGVIELNLLDNGLVKVLMGVPSFDPKSLPFNPTGLPERELNGTTQWAIEFDNRLWWFSVCSMGNPHITLVVDQIDCAPVKTLGNYLEHHRAFPQRVNVGFLQILDEHNGFIRVWERGVGETLACGSGNCAAAATSINNSLMGSPVHLKNQGGDLVLSWQGNHSQIELYGPAETVFESEIEI